MSGEQYDCMISAYLQSFIVCMRSCDRHVQKGSFSNPGSLHCYHGVQSSLLPTCQDDCTTARWEGRRSGA